MKSIYKTKSNSGYSLVELMVVISIMGLVGLGTASLIKNVVEIQRVQESKSSLLSFSQNLQAILRNDTNWAAIISHASNNVAQINCLIDDNIGPFCATGTANIPFDVYTHDGVGAPVLFYAPRASAANGLTTSGALCNPTGTAACPFRINLTLQTDCFNGQLTCPKPQVTITANLVKAAIDDPVVRKTDDRTAANGGTISFTLRRGDNVRYEPFEIVHQSVASAAALTPPAGGGGGACGANTWLPRPLSTVLNNVGNNMTFNNAADTFTLVPGTYECSVAAEGYDQITGFKIQLEDMTTAANSVIIGSAVTGNDSSSSISSKVEIRPLINSVYRINHYCTTPSDDTIVPSSDMGRPLPNYMQQTVFTRVYCVRTL